MKIELSKDAGGRDIVYCTPDEKPGFKSRGTMCLRADYVFIRASDGAVCIKYKDKMRDALTEEEQAMVNALPLVKRLGIKAA